MEIVSELDIKSLLECLSKNPFRVRDQDCKADESLKKCKELFAKDYKFSVIENHGGELVATYPSEMVIPQQVKCGCCENKLNESSCSFIDSACDGEKLRELMVKSRVARCRARFPIPVIFFDGKYICRSATLSGGPEIYGRSGYDFLFAGNSEVGNREENDFRDISINQTSSEWQLFGKVRMQDIRLLKTLSVGYICDLMVEKKKVKFGMNVTSSEKVDKENRYGEFTILSLPYPGCEFFRDYRDNGYNAEGLVFDWNQAYVDAQIGVPSDQVVSQLDIDWDSYKSWDLVRLTQNYLKLQLKYLVEGTSGLLIHCISGWDRTPLFVSLLRLSLWADGKAHASLTPTEITYLTIAYDWYLFGHDLPDRLSKGEEIFFFCFYFLKYLMTEDFSAHMLQSHRNMKIGSKCKLDSILLEEFTSEIESLGNNSGLNSRDISISPCQVNHFSNLTTSTSFNQPNGISDELSLHSNGNILEGLTESFIPTITPKMDYYANSNRPCTPPTLTNSSCSQASVNSFQNDTLPHHSSPTSVAQIPHTVLSVGQKIGHLMSKNITTTAGTVTTKAQNISTTPVAVPNSSKQRSESCSSMGCGSWQIISGTGSVRDSVSTSSLSSPTLELNHNSGNSVGSISQDSGELQAERNMQCSSWSHSQLRKLRQERLQAVRNLFYNLYAGTIGFKFRNGSNENRGITNLLENFAEKVGFRSTRTTAV